MKRIATVFALVVSWLVLCGFWTTDRHDLARTGRNSEADGDITVPMVKFEHDLGGHLEGQQLWLHDVNGDDRLDFVMITSGRLVVQEVDGTVLWGTRPMELSVIVGIDDLNCDGEDEIVVVKSSKPRASVYVLDASTGALRWEEGDTVGDGSYGYERFNVRLADLDTVCGPELMIWPTNAGGFAFTFDGLTGETWGEIDWMWNIPDQQFASNSPIVGDFLAPLGEPDVFAGTRNFCISDQDSPCLVVDSLANYAHGLRMVTDLDGNGYDEIALADGQRGYLPLAFGVFQTQGTQDWLWGYFLDTHDSAAPDLHIPHRPVKPTGTGHTYFISVYNDGSSETFKELGVAMTAAGEHDGINRPHAWTAAAFNALDGLLLDQIDDEVTLGVEDLGHDGDLIVVTGAASEETLPDVGPLHAHRFNDQSGSFEALAWQQAVEAVPIFTFDPGNAGENDTGATNGSWRLTLADPDGDTEDEILVAVVAGDVHTLHWLDPLDLVQPLGPAGLSLPAGVTAWSQGVYPDLSAVGAGDEIVLVRTDGHVTVLNTLLSETTALESGFLPMREAMVAPLADDGRSLIVTTNSLDQLVALDGADMSVDMTTTEAASSFLIGDYAPLEEGSEALYVVPAGTDEWEVVCRKVGSQPAGDQVCSVPLSSINRQPRPRASGDFDSGTDGDEVLLWHGSVWAAPYGMVAVSPSEERTMGAWDSDDGVQVQYVYPYEYYPAVADITSDGHADQINPSFSGGSIRAYDIHAHLDEPVPSLFSPLFLATGSGFNSAVALADLDGDGQPLELFFNGTNTFGFGYSIQNPGLIVVKDYVSYGDYSRGRFFCLADADRTNGSDGLDIVRTTNDGMVYIVDGTGGLIRHAMRLENGSIHPTVLDAFEDFPLLWDVAMLYGAGTMLANRSEEATDTTVAVDGTRSLRITMPDSGGAAVGGDVFRGSLDWDLVGDEQIGFYAKWSLDVGFDLELVLFDGAAELIYSSSFSGASNWNLTRHSLDQPTTGDASAFDFSEVQQVSFRVHASSSLSTDTLSLDHLHIKNLGPDLNQPACANIDGDDHEDAIIGSSDGHLVAIDVETGALVWALDMVDALASPSVADIDDDGDLDIVVTAGSGVLSVIDHNPLNPPAGVMDIGFGSGGGILWGEDVDYSPYTDRIAVQWSAASGAGDITYAIALVTGDSTRVYPSDGSGWADVGDVVQFVLGDSGPAITLEDGEIYRFLVQANSELLSASIVAESDGFLVVSLFADGFESGDATRWSASTP